MGRNISEFLSREENQIIQKIWSSIKSNGSHKEVIKRIMPNGDERFIISSFTPVTDEDGNIYKIFYLGQDITEQKLKYDLLAEANKEIERLKKLVGEE
jgi:PAS domain-containing protein